MSLPTGAPAQHPNILFYANWTMDVNHNGLDDTLDAELAQGATGRVYLFVHYGLDATEAQAAVLRQLHGVDRTYVFHRWDTIQAEGEYEHVMGIRGATGVVAVEKFELPLLDMAVAAKATRVREEPLFDDGIDHNLAVHEDAGLRGDGMVIAVLDTGVNNLHQGLDDLDDDSNTSDPKLVQKAGIGGVMKYGGADTTNGFVTLGCVDPVDSHEEADQHPSHGHGTHVAGIAVGTGAPAHAHIGVAPKAKMVDLSIFYQGIGLPQGLGLALAWEWVLDFNDGTSCYGDPGPDAIDVATMSAHPHNNTGKDPNSFINLLLTNVTRSGVVVTLPAGNTGPGNGSLMNGAEGAIIVANADDQDTVGRSGDKLVCSSSRGPRLSDGDADLIDERRPDVTAPGYRIMGPDSHSLTGYHEKGGTSQATPHVAGVAALMLQADGGLRPVDRGNNSAMGDAGAVPVRDLLQQSAQPKEALRGGCPDGGEPPALQFAPGRWPNHAWNNGWGYGLVDAWVAVQAALAP